MIRERKELQDLKKTLDKKGCGFCLAKWTQVTIHLATGETHSCHHPVPHKIPVREIKRNPSALHNTRYKKKQRRDMLEGKRPAECDYCWNIEDNSDQFSDRIYKSNEPWSKPYLEEIKNLGWRDNYNPKYVEVSFSTTCNFKCSYCGPSFSTTWMQEIKKHGAYPTSEKFNDIEWFESAGKMPIPHDEYNPYVEAFWKWWPDLYRDLHTFRITGGEPLLSKDTWKILDFLIEEKNPNKKLKLGINTNLGVPDALIDKLIEKLKLIEERDIVSEIVLYTSCDSSGDQANYIRHGLNFDQFRTNVEKILQECRRTSIVIMSTFNALSIPHYWGLMDFALQMKKKYNNEDRYWHPAVFLDSSYLRYPRHQTVRILPKEWSEEVRKLAQWCDDIRIINKEDDELWQPWHQGFTDIEVNKLNRIADWMDSPQDEEEQKKNKRDFYNFISSHDKRRDTHFTSVFPQFADFYEECKKLNEEWLSR